jgi:cellulose synthase/poly-beta-1,6-N-acetylglucosamine synthase-like glycosyltransferase
LSEAILIIIGFLLIHTYLLFPLSLPLLASLVRNPRKFSYSDDKPSVSILISAYNEESIIEEKILNSLKLDYPSDKLEILIGTDGCTDRTADIIRRYQHQVNLHECKENRGKAAMLNELKSIAKGEVLLFCDANTWFFPNVVQKIIQPFQDPKIGCVCGRLILSDSSQSSLGEGESAYWDFESEIKKFEGMMDIIIGGNGALYAIRKNLYSDLPVKRSIMDDFYITTKILLQGYSSTFVSSAIGTEQTSKEGMGEFKRKVRIGRANFNYLPEYLRLLNPLRPLVAYSFLSHKLLRWVSPHMLISFLLCTLFLIQSEPLYYILLLLQVFIIALGLVGYYMNLNQKKYWLTSPPYYFLSMNLALLIGFFQSMLPEKSGGWERVERGDETTHAN